MALHFDKTVEKKDFELIAAGEYEVTLSADWGKTKAGDPFINCTYTIRKDVQQDFGGRLIFDGIYKSKLTGEFQASKLNGILAAIPDSTQDFETYDDVIQYISGANMIVEVEVQKGDPGYNDKNVIKYLSYKPTVVGPAYANTSGKTLVEEATPDTGLPF